MAQALIKDEPLMEKRMTDMHAKCWSYDRALPRIATTTENSTNLCSMNRELTAQVVESAAKDIDGTAV